MPAILFPDIEAAFIGYMAPALAARPEVYAADVAVRNRVPNESTTQPWPASKRLVVVRDDGGQARIVRGIARLGIRVWAEDEATTSDLANLVMALVNGWHDAVIRGGTASRPYSVTEVSSRPCMYFTAELVVIGRKLPAA